MPLDYTPHVAREDHQGPNRGRAREGIHKVIDQRQKIEGEALNSSLPLEVNNDREIRETEV